MSLWSRLFGRKMKKRSPSYAAAANVARYADFNASRGSADAELQAALAELRAKSRGLIRNDPYAKRYVKLLQDNVVGPTGFKLQVQARYTNGGMDTPGNGQVERAWKDWSRVGTADGRRALAAAGRMAARRAARGPLRAPWCGATRIPPAGARPG